MRLTAASSGIEERFMELVYLTKVMGVDVTVTWTLTPNTSGSTAAACADFLGGVCGSGTVTIPAGSIQVALPAVQAITDGLVEGDQSFRITLSNVLPSSGAFAVSLERPRLTGKILANIS